MNIDSVKNFFNGLKSGGNSTLYVILAILLIVSLVFNAFFGYSYKKVTEENKSLTLTNETLKKTINTKTDEVVTKTPVLIGNRIAYKEVITKKSDTATDISMVTNTRKETESKKVTEIRKDPTIIAVGKDFNLDSCFSIQKNFIDTPFGNIGLEVYTIPTDLKLTSLLVTYSF